MFISMFYAVPIVQSQPEPPPRLTQPLQRAVAADLGFHGGLVGRRQLGEVVEGVGEGRVAAVVPHAPSHAAAAPVGTFTTT